MMKTVQKELIHQQLTQQEQHLHHRDLRWPESMMEESQKYHRLLHHNDEAYQLNLIQTTQLHLHSLHQRQPH
jgi:hypothetical protein